MRWGDLTMRERSDLMSLFLGAGVDSLSDMRRIYDEGGPIDDFDGGTLKESKVTATLTREQWNNLYRNGKVSLSEVPRKYQSWIEGQNSKFKRDITNTISNAGTVMGKVALAAGSFIPAVE